MPLEHSSSADALHDNMRTLHAEIGRSPHVQSRAQAIAIGLETQRRARAAGHADGGGVIPFRQVGGPINPAMLRPPMQPGLAPPGNVMPMGVAGPSGINASSSPLPGNMRPGPGGPMPFPRRASGGFNIAKQPNLNPPNYFERAESRDMMHGPLMTSSPGRADSHYTKVPSGSYVLPAAHIASMGQGNSMAGLKLAQSQFGLNGPYGIGAMKMPRGPGAPRPPRPMGGLGGPGFAAGGYSEGGARGLGDHGHGRHRPVDVALSGGEYVIHPDVVRNIGHGSIEDGHRILDSYVMHARRKEVATLRKLPPPAKK